MNTDMAELHRSYQGPELRRSQLAADWLTQFRNWFETAAHSLTELEPNAMVLATASAAGAPSVRTVLCKQVDAEGFVFFTHYASRKGREIAERAEVSLLFRWLDLSRQVIVEGRAAAIDAAESDRYFRSRPHGSQIGALASPQSSVLASRDELDAEAARLRRRYPEGNSVPRPPDWGGIRVRPHSVEFLQGRPDRLHDLLRYRYYGRLWRVERLAP
ncbi:MAG: pyridoxamine 5'-phosphate oxidase [Mycobacteriales bacterium]